MSTAKPLDFNNGNETFPYLAPVPLQGGGLAQAWTAAHSTIIPSTSKFIFNDTQHFVKSHRLSLRNTGSKEVTYALRNRGAATANTFDEGSRVPAHAPELVQKYADINFSKSQVTVPAGGEAVISFSVTPPQGLVATRVPVYSGYIVLDSESGDKLSIPYMGVSAK